MKLFNKNIEEENRKRLRAILSKIPKQVCPSGWEMKTFAVGGLTEIGFSDKFDNLLSQAMDEACLIVQSSKKLTGIVMTIMI